MHHNKSNNLEATFVKLSEKSNIFQFIDVLLKIKSFCWWFIENPIYWCLSTVSESYCFVTVADWRSKEQKNRFVINVIWKLISIKLLIFRFDKSKLNVINKWCHAEVNRTYPTCAFIKFIFRATFFWPFMTLLGSIGNWNIHTRIFHGRVSLFQFPIKPQICS